tara:strand:- start:4439 stop:7192 length:2754 start_codon:yes stop_codon:yes gene_type:complete
MAEKDSIIIKGARLHNLKNISVNIPKNKMVVITGVSGSGKSTLAYDTIYAEAQRRYIQSLSSYARQFLKNHKKPEVEYIQGLSPAIAIEHKTSINNSRSTVGTITEIYYYLTILYERIGKTFSPISGKEVKKDSFKDFKQYINQFKKGDKFIISCQIEAKHITSFLKEGYHRVIIDGEMSSIEEITCKPSQLEIVIDRLAYNTNDEFKSIIKETYTKAINIGAGEFSIYNENIVLLKKFNNLFMLDNIQFEIPNKDLLNFNNPYGACKNCNGNGNLIDLDLDKIIPDKNLSVIEDLVHPWRSGKMEKWKNELIKQSKKIGFPLDKKYSKLSKKEKDILWNGTSGFRGIDGFFNFLKKKSYKIQYRVMLGKYRSLSVCKVCNGNRLRKETEFIMINKQNIQSLINYSMSELLRFIKKIQIPNDQAKIIQKIKNELILRIESMINLGLDYLTLNRTSNSLSGGEVQKINITKSIGSGLIGSLYILDEPSVGLHPRDTYQLIQILKNLRNMGNSIIIVEHDKDIIQAADYIIDLGPYAGVNGGEIIYQGSVNNKSKKSLTLNYINRSKNTNNHSQNRKPKEFIRIKGIKQNNLKNISISIPIKLFTAITGVSGSGKTTLLKEVVLPAIKRKFKDYSFKPPKLDSIEFNSNYVESISFLNQNSIKKSSKSTPITYIKGFNSIRSLFANQKLAKVNKFTPKYFSFNTNGGRCDSCKGLGFINIEMQFLSDIQLICETCQGKRYKDDILNIYFKNKNISDILNLNVQEGYDFFLTENEIRISEQMKPLIDVGLGYLKLGQPVSTLSSGEAQRLKIASFLSEKKDKSILIFDEPTKGLHFYDIEILIIALQKLVDLGNTIIVIEHNLELIKNVDWVIDLGPEGGNNGGLINFIGTPDKLKETNTHTGQALKNNFNGQQIVDDNN